MLNVLMTASVSFLITLLAVPVIMKVAEEKKLYDLPDARKIHTRPIASLGGVGIFIGFFLALLLTVSSNTYPEFQYFFAAAIIIFFLGIKDDILVISAQKKFLGQMVAAAILIHLGDLRIYSMQGVFGITDLPPVLSYILSYATVIVVINAFNLIDGVDGLATTLGLLTMTVFGAYFFVADMPAYAALSFAMAGSLVAFLIFNYNPAKIFMGDSGSLLLGLINSILVIKFISVANNPNILFPIESAVAVGFSILMVPLADTLRVFSIRIFKGRSPFAPDRNHIHHLLLDRGLNHKYVVICCLLINILFISLAYFGRHLGPTFLLTSMAVMSFSMLGCLIYFKKPVKTIIVSKSFQPVVPTHSKTKVVSINMETAIAEN